MWAKSRRWGLVALMGLTACLVTSGLLTPAYADSEDEITSPSSETTDDGAGVGEATSGEVVTSTDVISTEQDQCDGDPQCLDTSTSETSSATPQAKTNSSAPTAEQPFEGVSGGTDNDYCDDDAPCTPQPEADTPESDAAPQVESNARTFNAPPAWWVPFPEECVSSGPGVVITRRFESCGYSEGETIVYRIVDGEPVQTGSLTANIYRYAFTNATYRSWVVELEYTVIDAEGTGIGATFRATPDCGGFVCDLVSDHSPNQTLDPGDSAYAKATYEWSDTTRGTAASGDGGWSYQLKGVGARWGNLVEVNEPFVRCDSIVRGVGCVFPSATPTMEYFNSGLLNDFADHVSAAQASGIAGAPGGTPLHRVMDTSQIALNRSTACGGLPRHGLSCDEYPFASTYEGAASAPTAGRTFPNCNVTAYPTGVTGPGFSVCMIPSDENSLAGSQLNSQLYQRMRVIDNDPFYVDFIYAS